MSKVSIIGAAGHIGLPLSLVLSNNGHHIYGIDIDQDKMNSIMQGEMPFLEEGANTLLKNALTMKSLEMTKDYSVILQSEVVVIIIGTQVSTDLSPNIEPIINLIKNISKYIKKDQLIVLRSTVTPGTVKKIKTYIEKELDFMVGKDLYLAFAPERSVQGKAIKEITELPQIIGAFDENSYKKAENFFSTFVKSKCLKLTPTEAELGKLMTNMFRYMQFAIANEFYLIADSYDENIHNILDAFSYNYPRLNIPSPGPNVGGPCLQKDGWFLLERVHYADLISTSFKINESMPYHILKKVEEFGAKKVAILGMTFKANNDDSRNSLSYKLLKSLTHETYEVVCIDPYLSNYSNFNVLKDADVVILMTPHKEFKDLKKLAKIIENPNCNIIDIWGFWEEIKHLPNKKTVKIKDLTESQ